MVVARSEVVLAARLGTAAPRWRVDADGRPTRDNAAALLGALLPFGGHNGFGLSLIAQALGLLGGAALPRGLGPELRLPVHLFDPGLLMPPAHYKEQLAELVRRIKAPPRQPGADESAFRRNGDFASANAVRTNAYRSRARCTTG
jgi:LDH2 family malate/lactate/ureidoglycolate dehydrogenase